MNPNFKITDKKLIHDVLDKAEYGTLAVSSGDKPYAVPVNFVRIDDDIYFHGALKNKKMKILAENPHVSFSVVENYALIDSDFSSTEGLACPATQFFKSVSIEGMVSVLEDRNKKAEVFEKLMLKLQPKGGYKPFNDSVYDKAIKATAVIKIEISDISCKFKFGQHLNDERFEMICRHLEERGSKIDLSTVEMMRAVRVC
ncbi:pyridoxamine 5'-phosphate oxidase family protein [Sulfurovum sp.]|uniref:pyridoxamine 5'-phosphate oxidase family protein n=1 Tax=Sulfurovum sp. TaxID=1969726 RepID=UPI0025F38B57|nr:pyridoxamine 5'-phosphate oxidase family protein [Sulfurovum sp.]